MILIYSFAYLKELSKLATEVVNSLSNNAIVPQEKQ